MPAAKFFPPQLATLVETAPTGKLWMNETKYDGYRILAMKSGDAAAAARAWAPVRERIARRAPPEFVYRPKLATWPSSARAV